MKTGLVPADNRLEGMPDQSRGQPPAMRTTSRARDLYHDALRLPWAEIERILAELAEREAREAPTERRSEPRHAYQGHPTILVEVTDPDGSIRAFRCVARNISTRGLGFLHGRYVFPGSVCKLILRTVERALVCVAGTIVWCRHVEGRVHEVGLKFDSPLELKDFILDANAAPAEGEAEQKEQEKAAEKDGPALAEADQTPPEGQAGEPQ